MECQKVMILSENTPNQPSKFKTKSWVEVNHESRGMYNVNSQIKFEGSMLRSSLCDFIDAYIYTCDWTYNSSSSRTKQQKKYNN